MNKSRDSETLKQLIKMLISSFLCAFLGAGWVAYAAIELGDLGYVWLPLSAVGAVVACGVMLALSRSYFRLHMLN